MKLLPKILNILFPNKCLCCDQIISFDANFCLACWQKLKFIKPPNCQICAYPFEIQIYRNDYNICSNCLKKPPFFDKTLSVFRYNETIGRAIGNLKYRDQTHLAQSFAKILANQIAYEIENCDYICAVPLHHNKLKTRKFNQALLIAKNLGSPKLIVDLLIRTKHQTSQVKLSQKQRLTNIKQAFKVNPQYAKLIAGKKILLIDDVITTSATVNAAAHELKKSRVELVVVATLAKTIFD